MKIEVLDHGYVEFVEAWGHGKDGDQPFESTLSLQTASHAAEVPVCL